MSTAVLISGHARTFERTLPTQNWHVFRRLDDPHFFVSVVDDEQASSIYLLEGLYPGKVFVETVAQPVLNIPGTNTVATSSVGDSQRHQLAKFAPYAVSASLQGILRQLWHLNRVFEFYASATDGGTMPPFDTFVRIRPDLWFHSFEAYKTLRRLPDSFFGPLWSRCGGCNDRFGVMGATAAAHYFQAFHKVERLIKAGCPLHPESMIAASLEDGLVDVNNTLQANFRTLRLDSTTVAPVIYQGEQEAFAAAVR